MITDQLHESPSFENLQLTPNFSPTLHSSLKSEAAKHIVVDIPLLEEVLSQTRSTIVTWSPNQVSKFLVAIWRLPRFMEADITSYCCEAELSGATLLSMDDIALKSIGFNELWLNALLDALALIFKHFPEKLPLEKLCKTPEVKINFSEINYNLKRKLSFLQKYYPLMNDSLMLELNSKEDFIEFENDDGTSSVFDLGSEFDDDDLDNVSLPEESAWEDDSNNLDDITPPSLTTTTISPKLGTKSNSKPSSRSASKPSSPSNKPIKLTQQRYSSYWIIYLGIGSFFVYKLIQHANKS